MSVARGRIHQGHERFSDDPQGRQIATDDFKCLAAHSQYSLSVEALNVIVELSKSLPIVVNNSTTELIDQVLLHGHHFFLIAFSSNFLFGHRVTFAR